MSKKKIIKLIPVALLVFGLVTVSLVQAHRSNQEETEEVPDCLKPGWDAGWDDGWDAGFDTGQDIGTRGSWSEGWDDGWNSRGKCFPDINGTRKYGLAGVRKMRVFVWINPDGKHDELKNTIKSFIESRLRMVGIEPVDEYAEDEYGRGRLVLDASIIDWGNGQSLTRLGIYFSRNALAFDYREGEDVEFSEITVITWNGFKSDKLRLTKEPRREIRDLVSEQLDVFTNEWLKENPKTA